ncbi:MAG TPA: hypothetical protein VGM91_15855 [Conexibacter sp.]|jgi:glucose/arabinose dehydrogenase
MNARRSTRSTVLGLAAASAASAAAAVAFTGTASAQEGPPPLPTAANGHTVRALATGVPTPTSFAFAGSTVFAGSGPDESPARRPGGLFTIANGRATRVPGSPPIVFGLAWRKGTLYVSTPPNLVAMSGWNGRSFRSTRVIYRGRRGFAGFNGLAFGPNGRLYAGLSLDERFDDKKDPFQPSQGIVSLKPNGSDLRFVARGLRQPFQLTFPKGSKNPFGGVLQQESGRIPPDMIIIAKPGQNYGFPACPSVNPARCRRFAQPLVKLRQHASPMGIGAIGSTLYVALFGGIDGSGRHPAVVRIPRSGGRPVPFITGFVAPIVGLGIHNGNVFVGDLTGTIYSVHA